MSDFAILRKRSSIKSFRKNTFGAFNEFIPASYVRFGSFSDLGVRDDRVRFAPMTGHRQPDRGRPKSANKGSDHPSFDHLVGAPEQRQRYG
jgi:hypothetical protein